MTPHTKLIQEMTRYYSGDAKRIQHFLKVYEFASLICDMENVEENTKFLTETAAIVHDIGIKISEEKYNSSAGKYQELEGPDVARPMLKKLGYAENFIERVCYLIGHHHTYHNIQGIDYQILVEADFLVNMYEDELSKHTIESALKKIFKTEAGIWLCKTIYQM